MSMERFEEIVEAAKEQEIEINGLKETLERMQKVAVQKVKDTEVVKNNGVHYENKTAEKVLDHTEKTGGFKQLTGNKVNDKIDIVINYINPETGRQTSMHRKRDNVLDALIARNEMAATLVKEGLIDFEKYLRITQG